MTAKSKILEYLEVIAPILPAPVYWLDKNNTLLGANKPALKMIGADSFVDIIGKRAFDVYPRYMAEHIIKHDNEVMRTGKTLSQEEETRDFITGKLGAVVSIKSPLYNEDGIIIGIVGTSVDITAQKEAERLKLENQKLELESATQRISAQLEEHKKFRKVADQMAHDLGSPLMALSVLESRCAELPEAKRNMLRESISSIREIAGSLLNQYKPTQEEIKASDELESKELLIYAILQQIIMDKQYEYQHLPVKFDCEYTKNSIFAFVKSDLSAFKRMLSNLINNAVEAIDGTGKIILKLDSSNKEVKVSVIDDGQGMSESSVNKIMSNISFSVGKEDGHGIGFSQVHETLEQSHGRLAVDSKEGIGTTITLTFPKMTIPEWIAEEITIQNDDTIIILDDDNSIHGAWDIRFNEVIKTNPSIQVKHFTQATDVINFVNSLENKDNIVLLSDYELLRQKLNGLDVIESTKLKLSILVTSHYADIEIRRQAYKMDTKILPKLLASEIRISVQ